MEKNALLSVYHKTGLVEFAQELVALGWKIFSSDGTAKALRDAKIPVTDIAELTGFPPVLGHRVVTLVPQIHGGLLAAEEHREELRQLGYQWIDLICVDLYPLKEEVRRSGATRESVIEKTDSGGPALIRSATKGRRIVIVDPHDRARVIEWLKNGSQDEVEFRNALAAKAEAIVADYCLESARFHGKDAFDGAVGAKTLSCKYGENAWQAPAALFTPLERRRLCRRSSIEIADGSVMFPSAGREAPVLTGFTQGTDDNLALQNFRLLEGNAPSYNNLCDLDRLLQTITHIAAVLEQNDRDLSYIAVGAKHGNSCGAAIATNAEDAIYGMIAGDPLALFGGLVITNFPLLGDEATALRRWNMQVGTKRLLDGVAAPLFSEEAKIELNRKGGKCRLLENSALAHLGCLSLDEEPRFRYVRGGFLRQPNYTFVLNLKDPDLEIIGPQCSEAQATDLLLAWAVGSTSNSNTVTLVKNRMLVGNGVGQQDRVGAATLAVARAKRSGHDTTGAVAYSDSFFPFPDGPQILIDAGVRAILASSGSINDEVVRETCRRAGITLYFLPDQKCRGFFGH